MRNLELVDAVTLFAFVPMAVVFWTGAIVSWLTL